jgi:hypothetical protein
MSPAIVARLVANRNTDEYSRIIFFMALFEVVVLAPHLNSVPDFVIIVEMRTATLELFNLCVKDYLI